MISIDILKTNLNGDIYDNSLLLAYPGRQLSNIKARINGLLNKFCQAYNCSANTEISLFSAPGRTELGGNHTDHQNGRVLAAAVDMDILACARPNRTGVIRLDSEGFGEIMIDISCTEPSDREKNTPAALARGVAAACAKKGYRVEGFDACIVSELSAGAGLSSSAAFEILLGFIINHFFNEEKIPVLEIAKAGQYAENNYFGKPCGLMDQLASSVGGIVSIDFHDSENIKMNKLSYDFSSKGYELCIVNTGSGHEALNSEYAAITAEMGTVASQFGKKLLSQVPEEAFFEALPRLRKSCGDRAVLRALHFFGETARVKAEAEALADDDISGFLDLVTESGRSSYMYLQNIYSEGDSRNQNIAVALAAADHILRGGGACRVHGGGFAGAIQAYVPEEMLKSFISEMDRIFGEGSCMTLNIRTPGGCVLVS